MRGGVLSLSGRGVRNILEAMRKHGAAALVRRSRLLRSVREAEL